MGYLFAVNAQLRRKLRKCREKRSVIPAEKKYAAEKPLAKTKMLCRVESVQSKMPRFNEPKLG
jgi:hypothetical protein